MGVRGKLIAIFILVKVIPLILLALLAWYQITQLASTLREEAVSDSVEALNHNAIENIERITTSVANEIAAFLYERDTDIGLLATVKPQGEDYQALEEQYRSFMENRTGRLVVPGTWELAGDGMSWERVEPAQPQDGSLPEEVLPAEAPQSANAGGTSTNSENNDVVNGASWHYLPPDEKQTRTVSYYDEIVFLDPQLRERAKVVADNSTKLTHPLDPELRDVSDRTNTYVGAETYAETLATLGADDIYVSDVIGAYVPSHYIGMYTPKQMAISAVNAEVSALKALDGSTLSADAQRELSALINELTTLSGERIAALEIRLEQADGTLLDNATLCTATNNAVVALLEELRADLSDSELIARLEALKERIAAITFNPEQEAYAGEENPNGVRFEGIIRWIKPVYEGKVLLGYVSFALNHDFIMEFVDHVTPMEERYTEIPSAFYGNYTFIWDYQCRSIAHPRHHSIVGYDKQTGLEEIPWLETSLYEDLLRRTGSTNLAQFEEAWPAVLNDPQTQDANNPEVLDLIKDVPAFDAQSRSKKPAPELTKAGYVGLDGRYLNNAPQCTGWMDLTRSGGSGSFYILWSGVYKLTTAAAIPYYTGQYAPGEANGYSKRGFAMVTVGAGLEDFQRPAVETGEQLTLLTDENLADTSFKLIGSTAILVLIVILIAVLLANGITGNIRALIKGVSRFRAGQRQFRFNTHLKDEFGVLADSFDDMADGIVASVSAPMSIVDSSRNIIHMNPAGLRVIGKVLGEVVGKPYSENSIYAGGQGDDPITAYVEGREAEVLKINGRYYHGVATDFLGKNGEKLGYYVVTTDVTDIQQARELAEQANEAKTAFLSNMSHEMRTPLNAVIGMTAIGKSANDKDKKDYCFGKIDSASKHLLGVINDILDISKIESGHFELSVTELALARMLRHTSSVMAYRMEEKHQKFCLTIDEALPPVIKADDQRLAQVITNLLGNAVKFTGDGGTISLEAQLLTQDADTASIKIAVSDTGIGIAPEQLGRIFGEFEQAESNTSRSYGGTGLGLAISKRLINMMGGSIEVVSEVGKGSTFSFIICVEKGTGVLDEAAAEKAAQDGDETAASVEGAIVGTADSTFAGRRILLVEDLEVNREIVATLLEPTLVAIDSAENGREALEMFQAAPNAYDLIFMDIQMPVMDGLEATRLIRALDLPQAQRIPIVAMTANVFREEVEEYLAAGMTDHIGKPINLEELIAKLKHYFVT
jgi:signal transduction histidine kinase/ActR/RegA family two-component response regulator